MSEQEKETELVVGTIEGTLIKKEGTWQVLVKPDGGGTFTKNLWTKSAETVEAMDRLKGEHRAFACSVSHWTNNDGKPMRSLWLESVQDGAGAVSSRTPITQAEVTQAQATPAGGTPTHKPIQAGEKDRAITRMACLKAASQIVSSVDEDPALTVMKAAARFEQWIYRDIDEVPFSDAQPKLSEHDDDIPY